MLVDVVVLDTKSPCIKDFRAIPENSLGPPVDDAMPLELTYWTQFHIPKQVDSYDGSGNL